MEKTGKRLNAFCLSCGVVVLAMVLPVIAAAEDYQELLFFPFVHSELVPHEQAGTHHEHTRVELGSDVFFALNYRKTRVVGEILITAEEAELERAQLGWEVAPKHFAWLGRFHAPLGFWNTQYNHAPFLQSSVHRPAIVEYEDHGGVFPTHSAGVMFEGQLGFGGGAIEYAISHGLGSKLGENSVESLRLVDASENNGEYSSYLRLAYRPDELSNTQYGIFGAYSNILPADGFTVSAVQTISGAYVYKTWISARIIASAFYVNNQLEENKISTKARFASSYLHGEYELTGQWMAYGRYEKSLGVHDDPYLTRFPDFTEQSLIGGIRYDWNTSHSIAVEVSSSGHNVDTPHHYSLQWSAVFP